MSFKPERYLGREGKEPEPDPRKFAFGFGRRVCPGRHLADNAVYLNIVQSLAVFEISKTIENGREVEPVVSFESGVISRPTPFKTRIRPRSPHCENLIRSMDEIYPWEESDFQVLKSIAEKNQI